MSRNVAAVTGPVLPLWETGTESYSPWFPKELYWAIGCTPWRIREATVVRNGFTSNLAVDRRALLEMEGFDENFGYNPRSRMTGEDPELGIRLLRRGYLTLWNPNAVVFHRVSERRLRIGNVVRRSFLEGEVKARLSKIYGNDIMKVEANHLQSTIKAFVTGSSLKAKASMLFATMAVFCGYSTHKILGDGVPSGRIDQVESQDERPLSETTRFRNHSIPIGESH